MKKAKINNATANGGSFPPYHSLGNPDRIRLRAKVVRALDLPRTASDVEINCRIRDVSQPLSGPDADDPAFDLATASARAGISNASLVYLEWNDFNAVDLMCFADVTRSFEDIWYPAADDLTIFDHTMEWFINVLHYGAIMVAQIDGMTAPRSSDSAVPLLANSSQTGIVGRTLCRGSCPHTSSAPGRDTSRAQS